MAAYPVFTLEGPTGLREALLRGAGVGLLAEWLAREELKAGRLVRLLPGWQAKGLPVQVIYPSGRGLSARARAFVEFTVQRMTGELRQE